MRRHLRAVEPRSGGACDRCLVHAWLVGRLAGHLEAARGRIDEVLVLSDAELIEAFAGDRRHVVEAEYGALDGADLRRRASDAGLELLCRCDPSYPSRLLCCAPPPAVLHVAGGLERFLALVEEEPVALVGARRVSDYGREVARALGNGLGCAGVTVISGMAPGIDSAAHSGALGAEGPTVAVLPAGAERPYPPAKRGLYNRIRAAGVVVSELPPGTQLRRWTFPARNRIIAGLSEMTVVVEAGERSGALVTARYARELGRPLGAVPGRITSPLSEGPNELLAAGAEVIRGTQDVLDALFGEGVRQAQASRRGALDGDLERLLRAIAEGKDTSAALSRAGLDAERGFAALSALELAGYVRREAGGRYAVVP